MSSHYLSPNEVTPWWLSLWPTDGSTCICSIMTRKIHKPCTVRLLTRLLTQQTCSTTHLCVKQQLFFLFSASVASQWLLQLNKQKGVMTKDNETWEVRSKNTPAITAYATGATKVNEMKTFLFLYCSVEPELVLVFQIWWVTSKIRCFFLT